MKELEFTGKVAVVTGGRQGIGRAITETLSAKGASVAILGRNKEAADKAAAELTQKGETVEAFECDISDEKSVQDAIDLILKKFRKIDFLVNDAGIYPAVPFLEMKEMDFTRVFDVNVKGIFLVTKEVVNRYMKNAKAGKIICISSVDGWLPSKGITAYAASKAAVNSMVKSFAIELADYNITANGVAPGWVATEPVLRAGRWKTQIDSVLKKRMAMPGEIGEMVAFLLSEKADYMNGETVNLSGGLLLNA